MALFSEQILLFLQYIYLSVGWSMANIYCHFYVLARYRSFINLVQWIFPLFDIWRQCQDHNMSMNNSSQKWMYWFIVLASERGNHFLGVVRCAMESHLTVESDIFRNAIGINRNFSKFIFSSGRLIVQSIQFGCNIIDALKWRPSYIEIIVTHAIRFSHIF